MLKSMLISGIIVISMAMSGVALARTSGHGNNGGPTGGHGGHGGHEGHVGHVSHGSISPWTNECGVTGFTPSNCVFDNSLDGTE
jgi:hypothetical protein